MLLLGGIMATPEQGQQGKITETPEEKWLRERRERVSEAKLLGEKKLDATFVGIYAAAGPGAAGGGDHEMYRRKDGTHFVWYGPQENYVRGDDPEEFHKQVYPLSGKYFLGGKREVLKGDAIKTVVLEKVQQHQYPWDGLFTSEEEYLKGRNVYESRNVNTQARTPKRAR
jgi:hypothetical protein